MTDQLNMLLEGVRVHPSLSQVLILIESQIILMLEFFPTRQSSSSVSLDPTLYKTNYTQTEPAISDSLGEGFSPYSLFLLSKYTTKCPWRKSSQLIQ